MIRKLLLTASMLLPLLLIHYCNKNLVGPEITPGRRDYTWQLDTLDMPVNYIDAVWGAFPNDVWAVGAGGTQNDRLLHYEGENWTTYTKEQIWCTGNSLFGFAADDVWMGGGGGWLSGGAGIWHYDGSVWSEQYVYKIDSAYSMKVQDIWGPAPNDVYASGLVVFKEGQKDNVYGFVLQFDGKVWQEVVKGPLNTQFVTIRKEGDNLYVQSYRNSIGTNDTEAYVFYEIEGGELREIYSSARGSLNVINGKAYFVLGEDVYRYIDGSLTKQLSIDDENFGRQIYGRSEIDMFLRMKDGLAHYNGTDTEYLYSFVQDRISIMKNAVLFEKEVFFGARSYSDSKNLILHGRLNK